MIYARRADPNALGRFIVAAGRILTVTGFPMLSRTRPMNGTPRRALRRRLLTILCRLPTSVHPSSRCASLQTLPYRLLSMLKGSRRGQATSGRASSARVSAAGSRRPGGDERLNPLTRRA